MLNIALYQPEIPPNTGNIIRLCANTNTQLHLIHPLGFNLSDKQLRRAGLDYHELTHVTEHQSFDQFQKSTIQSSQRIWACETGADQYYHDVCFAADDVLLFGPETRGLPETVLSSLPSTQRISIPMQSNSRSLNLSNATAIILYEALRQLNFPGCVLNHATDIGNINHNKDLST